MYTGTYRHLFTLTPREVEASQYLHLPPREAAIIMGISTGRLTKIFADIRSKLGVATNQDAIAALEKTK